MTLNQRLLLSAALPALYLGLAYFVGIETVQVLVLINISIAAVDIAETLRRQK